jgi:hypothetical protein
VASSSREQLEEKSDDEQKETIHRQRKRAIERWLTPSPALRRTQFGTQHEEQSGRPRALLDIIVERIFVALPERPQRGGTLHHFPHAQDHDPAEIEEQANDEKALHAWPASGDVLLTAGCPCAVHYQSRRDRRGMHTQQRPPKKVAVSHTVRQAPERLHCPRWLTSAPDGAHGAVHAVSLR